MSADAAADVLFSMRIKGVRIWLDGEQVKYRAEPGVIEPSDLIQLRQCRGEIVRFLGRAPTDSTEPPLLACDRTGDLPVSPYQAWRYHMFHSRGIDTRVTQSYRCIGPLDLASLKRAFAQMFQIHEALRTTLTVVDGRVRQVIQAPPQEALEIREASSTTAKALEVEAHQLVMELASEPVNLAEGPLFRAMLLKGTEQTHFLVISIHSSCWDGVSAGIFWRDLWQIYQTFRTGSNAPLPHVAIQPADFAPWLEQTTEFWRQRYETYWRKRLSGATRVRMFDQANDDLAGLQPANAVTVTSLQLGEDLVAGLRNLCSRERTSLGTVVLTGFVACLMRWCDSTDMVVTVHTTGRSHAAVEDAMGRFQCPLFLRIELHAEDTFVDLLQRVTEEYGTAHEHQDFGRLSMFDFGQELALNPNFNWIPAQMMVSAESAYEASLKESVEPNITLQSFKSHYIWPVELQWEGEPQFVVQELAQGLAVGIAYRTKNGTLDDLERLKSSFRRFLQTLATSADSHVSSVVCVC